MEWQGSGTSKKLNVMVKLHMISADNQTDKENFLVIVTCSFFHF